MSDDNHNKTNLATPQSLPTDFNKQAEDDDKRHLQADENDESGELDELGEDNDNKPLDIDQARAAMNLNTKDPAELDSQDDLDADELNS